MQKYEFHDFNMERNKDLIENSESRIDLNSLSFSRNCSIEKENYATLHKISDCLILVQIQFMQQMLSDD